MYDGYANTQFKSLLLKSFLYDGRVGMLKKNCPSTRAELFCGACTKFIFLFPFLHFGPFTFGSQISESSAEMNLLVLQVCTLPNKQFYTVSLLSYAGAGCAQRPLAD